MSPLLGAQDTPWWSTFLCCTRYYSRSAHKWFSSASEMHSHTQSTAIHIRVWETKLTLDKVQRRDLKQRGKDAGPVLRTDRATEAEMRIWVPMKVLPKNIPWYFTQTVEVNDHVWEYKGSVPPGSRLGYICTFSPTTQLPTWKSSKATFINKLLRIQIM